MENKIELFKNKELGEVRTLFIDGECWFVARDIAKCLGYERLDNMYKIIDNEDKKEINPQSTDFTGFLQNGGIQLESNTNIKRMIIVNESGMYSAIFNSELKTAKKFKHWVTSEVLPSIRKHGAYITEELLQDNDRLNDVIAELQMENRLKEREIKELNEVRTEYMKQRDKIIKIQIKSGGKDGSFIPYCILQLAREFIKDSNNIEYKDDDIIKVKSRKLINFAKRLFPKNHDAQYYLSVCLDIKTWDKCSIIPTGILKEDYEPIQDILY